MSYENELPLLLKNVCNDIKVIDLSLGRLNHLKDMRNVLPQYFPISPFYQYFSSLLSEIRIHLYD